MQSNRKKRLTPLVIAGAVLASIILTLLVAAFAVVAYTNIVVLSVDSDIAETVSEKEWDEDYDCILVLGAGLRSDGTPSDMLADRLKIAYELYEAEVSDVIVLSGDRSGSDYDEVTAMRIYLEDMGVPEGAIVEDGAGYSTYESVYNLKSENKYKKIVVVTQKYHLYRALYIAEEMGMSADGANGALRGYRGQIYRDIREVAARTKDFFMTRFGGESV